MPTQLSSKSPGSLVYLYEDSDRVAYLEHDHFDYGCTLIWRDEVIPNSRCFREGRDNYDESDIPSYCNRLYNSFDDYVKENVVLTEGLKTDRVGSGYDYLDEYVFALGYRELFGGVGAPSDGSHIEYFSSNSRRRASQDYWIRSISGFTDDDGSTAYEIIKVNADGTAGSSGSSYAYVRPALQLRSTVEVQSDGTIRANQPPTTPSSISFTNPRAGQSITISWGRSTDPDNDSITYIVERQINSGLWTNLTTTSGYSTTTVCPSSGSTINFRVKARDTNNLESSYRTGVAKSIVYNSAPSAPASISFTDPRPDELITITWDASIDPNGDPVYYNIEYQIDNGLWTSLVSNLQVLTTTMTCPSEGSTINLRVYAHDNYNANSSYTTGVAKDIIYVVQAMYSITTHDPDATQVRFIALDDYDPSDAYYVNNQYVLVKKSDNTELPTGAWVKGSPVVLNLSKDGISAYVDLA